jgi:hypothetical protein
VLPDVFMPVASIEHLIALKALAGRHQDLTDRGYLISAASEADLNEARTAAAAIEERGFNRGQMLSQDLAAIITRRGNKRDGTRQSRDRRTRAYGQFHDAKWNQPCALLPRVCSCPCLSWGSSQVELALGLVLAGW